MPILHDVLLALVGHPGDVVRDTGETFAVVEGLPFLSDSYRVLANRIVPLGFHYRELTSFVDRFVSEEYSRSSVYVRALCEGLEDVLDTYRATLCAVEREFMCDATLSLSHAIHLLQEHAMILPALHRLVRTIIQDDRKGGPLLSLLHDRTACGVPVLRTCLLRLQQRYCHKVLFHQVAAWMMHGELSDPYEEFMVRDVEGSQSTTDEWSSRFVIRVEMRPSYLPLRVAQKILFVGKAVRVLRRASTTNKYVLPTEDCQAFVCALRDLQESESFALLPFELAVDRLRAVAVHLLWNLIILDADLPRHLRTLRDYFLLGRGEFWQCFLDDVRGLWALPPTATAERDTNSVLQQSAARYGLDEEEGFIRLRLRMPQEDPGWKNLGLEYRVDWPLHLLLTQDAMERYDELFRFLLDVKRIQTELQKAWASVMDRKSTDTGTAHRMLLRQHQLRSNMSFLVDNLQYYLQGDVVDVQFSRLVSRIEARGDFDEVKRAHEDFLTALTQQFFLRMRAVRKALEDVFKQCHALCDLLVRGGGGGGEEERIVEIERNFNRQAGFLFTVLSGVNTHQPSPHLAQLLLRVDFNRYFTRFVSSLGH